MTHVYPVGNVKRKLKLSSLCGMTVINCISKYANVVVPVHIKELELKKTAVIDRPKRLNVVAAKKIWSCGTLILIMKMTLIPVIVCKILVVKVII